jgi:hypothetical protein
MPKVWRQKLIEKEYWRTMDDYLMNWYPENPTTWTPIQCQIRGATSNNFQKMYMPVMTWILVDEDEDAYSNELNQLWRKYQDWHIVRREGLSGLMYSS